MLSRDTVVRAALSTLALVVSVTGASAATLRGSVPPDMVGSATSPVVIWLEGPKAPAAALKQRVLVSQKNMRFAPEFVVAVAGQMIQFPNDDSVAHSVFSESATKRFNLGIYDELDRRSVIVDRPGVVDVRCALHRNMKSTIVVVPTQFHAMADPKGAFEIGGVPPGKYRMVAWTRGKPAVATEVVVAAGTVVATFAKAARP